MNDQKMKEFSHIPVLAKEAISFLNVQKNGIYVDATLGGGGHSKLILEKLEKGKLIGIDQDKDAISAAQKNLGNLKNKIIYVRDNFRNLDKILDRLNISKVDGILIDLGVSSYQLENLERGFSFLEDEKNLDVKLDMRMDQEQEFSAYDVVNDYREDELIDIFYKFGEEPFARKIAKKIVQTRRQKPIETVGDLLQTIKSATPPKYRFSRRRHWAAKIFRSIRIEVNQELLSLEEVIPKAIDALEKKGRLVIISFHSLEDRITKHKFREFAKREKPIVNLLTKKPVLPSNEEILGNPKSESAKLRACEKA